MAQGVGMEAFEERVQKACKNLQVPGVVLVAGSADGKLIHLSVSSIVAGIHSQV